MQSMPGRTDSRRRLLVLLLALAVASTSLMARLAYWQVGQHDRLVNAAIAQVAMRTEIPVQRGTIYDSSGTVVLATTITRDRLVASPDQLTPDEQATVGERVIQALKLTGANATQVRTAMSSPSGYVVLATGLSPEASAAIRAGLADGSLSGLALEPQAVRVYPQAGGAPGTSLASQLIGFVNADGQGQYGVEQYYQELLSGRPEVITAERDVDGRPIADTTTVVDAGVPGADLRLTIDAGLQLQLEQEVFAAWVADRAQSVSAVLMDPHTGAVLAEATYPAYDANQYQQVASTKPSLFMDPVVSSVYEPGSVFKMLTTAAVLSKGSMTLATKINDTGILRLGDGQQVDDADKRARGWMTLADIVAWSRNVGATKAAISLGRTTADAAQSLFSTWLKFGIGQLTGIDVSGEVPGLVNNPSQQQWRLIDLANGSFGQGVAVTPIQLLNAYTAMANGGTLVQPHVVEAVGSTQQAPSAKGRIIDAGLSSQLTGLMNHVVTTVPFYAQGTLIPGYTVGGKTGTAQIWDPTLNGGKGDWKKNIFDYSFVGYVGRTAPEVMAAVVIREGTPTKIGQGVLDLPVESFELFRRIASDAMATLDLPPLAKASTGSSAASAGSLGTSSSLGAAPAATRPAPTASGP